ncbi:hypothetical protein E2562_034290 [Oryza meyeriana var. granulata]|uniref:Uncharacterized protein n=1 Tax=Oryza meyeriana var. granulata TaxID=110450 RepID=A0A6G1D990_9ORYZ|nr:hypothetical protein E2562_034290 [Oryza meyeriana var. granulata]
MAVRMALTDSSPWTMACSHVMMTVSMSTTYFTKAASPFNRVDLLQCDLLPLGADLGLAALELLGVQEQVRRSMEHGLLLPNECLLQGPRLLLVQCRLFLTHGQILRVPVRRPLAFG